jgi:peptidyl-prolyl cis-trans isomerase SurA
MFMKRFLFLCFCYSFFSTSASAQILFTYGNEKVTVSEFLKAYNKNNNVSGNDAKAIKDYLDLYIASRLKIKEAKLLRYDTLPQLVSDLQSLRTQIMPTYLNDKAATQNLVDEAFKRSQKDILLAHIFIPFANDTLAAIAMAGQAYKKLQRGSAFGDVAKEYSTDPSVKMNGGTIGYITAFTLPYQLETLAYTTPVGKLSPLFRSSSGFHIFKNEGERKALGSIKTSQILLSFPEGSGESIINQSKRLADSIYLLINKGVDFGNLATTFSNDRVSAASNGQMQEFSVGEYEPLFENTIIQLPVGGVSKPFRTAHGWHIVKKNVVVPVNTNRSNKEALQILRDKVEASDRIHTTKDELTKKIMKQAGLKKGVFVQNELKAFTDSALDQKRGQVFRISGTTKLFSIGKTTFTANDWISFARTNRYKNDGGGLKTFNQLWNDYLTFATQEYYKENLEQHNPEFKAQIEEFRDGNLFFEIMQRKVWGSGERDTAGLEKYYRQHTNKYVWSKSADAIMFYVNDSITAKALKSEIEREPLQWKTLSGAFGEKVAVDSNRFELEQIPLGLHTVLNSGKITSLLVNTTDNTASFAYILKMHTAGGIKSFTEAKGAVMNDYQAQIEKNWLTELKRKYPVSINQKALSAITKR